MPTISGDQAKKSIFSLKAHTKSTFFEKAQPTPNSDLNRDLVSVTNNYTNNDKRLCCYFTECWQLYHTHSCLHGLFPAPRTVNLTNTFYFGDAPTDGSFDWCKKKCSQEPLCYAFGMVLNHPRVWKRQCYGRGFGIKEIFFQTIFRSAESNCAKCTT